MINFRQVTLDDMNWVKEILAKEKSLSCEYCFANMYSYTEKISVELAKVYDCLVTKCYYDGVLSYCYPIGNGDRIQAIKEIIEDGLSRKEPFSIFGLNNDNVKELIEHFKDKFEIVFDRDGLDYVYLREDLAELKGKKYQPKRNHISYFKKNNNWSYEKMNLDNIPECIEMSSKWLQEYDGDNKEDLIDEFDIIKKALASFDVLGLIGGLIRVDGEVVAYTLGEEMTKDTFCTHFEKAYQSVRGAYPMINQQFAINELSAYTYIDREDDLGIENMRKAKLSYQPAILPDKYDAKYIL